MTIAVGDCIPSCTLSVMGDEGPAPVSTSDLFNGKKFCCSPYPAHYPRLFNDPPARLCG